MEAFGILLVPFIWFIFAKIWLRTTFNWTEFAISIGVVTLLVTAVVAGSKWGATQDTEIWNGKVTKKEMVDDYYQTSYSCNCTTTCSGSGSSRSCSESCDTCYTDHYTRSYDGYSTVGNWTFDSIDTEWRMRRDSFGPPASYTNCKVGEPAAREHSYTNYVQAVPQSLFHDDSTVAQDFAGKIPSYPRVHSFYKINRVLQVGVSNTHAREINSRLNQALITLGRSKQANIVVILTDIKDPTYRFAVENAWLGGEKNDVIVIIGLDGDNIVWSDTITWALNDGNELFNVTMRDGVKNLGTMDPDTFVPFVTSTISKLYDRPEMKDYEYLEDEIEPPTWALITAIILAFGGSAGLTFLFHHHEFGGSGYRFGRRNRYFRR